MKICTYCTSAKPQKEIFRKYQYVKGTKWYRYQVSVKTENQFLQLIIDSGRIVEKKWSPTSIIAIKIFIQKSPDI